MLSKRIIPCLDVRAGKLTKGVKFQGNIDIGDPVEAARAYYEQGADEIVFYDITASAEGRSIMIDVVRRVAETIFIPFSVGGGIRTVEDMRKVILAGAEKISVNTEAVLNPDIIAEGARAFGSQCIVLGMDVKKCGKNTETPSGYEMVIHGGRTSTGRDALAWAKGQSALVQARSASTPSMPTGHRVVTKSI
jgi:cyclase